MNGFYVRESEGGFQVCIVDDVSNCMGETHSAVIVVDVRACREDADKVADEMNSATYDDEDDMSDDDGVWYTQTEMSDDWNTYDYWD